MATKKITRRSASADRPRAARKTKPTNKHKGLLARLDGLWRKESNLLSWLTVALLMLLLINGIVLTQRLNDAAEQAAVKTPVANNNIAIMHFSWFDDFPAVPAMYQPNKGYKVIGVRVQILNLRSIDIWLAPAVESYVTDSSGNRYGMAIAEIQNPFDAGSYAPQKAASGELSYAIPQKADDLQWCYKLAISNGGGEPLCLALNKYSKTNY